MQDKTLAVLQTFGAYASALETLDPDKVISFFHDRSSFVTARQSAFITDENTVKDVIKLLFDDLKEKRFKRSKLNTIHVKQTGDNRALVHGSATCYRADGSILATLGLTYALREEGDEWKIVIGVVYEIIESKELL
jgi:ketosteroid isomerase-like protein